MTAPKRRPPAARLLALVAALAVSLLLVEGGFRLALATGVVTSDIWPLADVDLSDAIHRYSADRRLVYECIPGATSSRDGVPVRINAKGFRGRDFDDAPAPGVARVAVLGDSITFAVEVREEDTFTVRAEALLRARGGPSVEVLNCGVTGYNSDQERVLLDERVLAYGPTLVVAAYCMNDLTPADGIGPLAAASHPDAWGRRLRSHLVTWMSDQGARRSAWGRRSFDRPRQLFERMAQVRAEGRTRGLVVVFPQLDDARSSWNRPEEYDRARDLATAAGLPVVDVRAALDGLPSASVAALFADRTHLSPRGHEFVAALLADAIARELAAPAAEVPPPKVK